MANEPSSPQAPAPVSQAPRLETIVALGIESTCDETAAAIIAKDPDGSGRILANVVRSQWENHRLYGGVVPEIAARAHVECLDVLIEQALKDAVITLSDIDCVAASAGPGLIGGLIVGTMTAKAIALAKGVPFIAVNHLEAHALTVGLTSAQRPPYLLFLASGGHTQLLLVRAVADYTRIGTTIDDALGEAFDKTAKLLGLPQPGGPNVEKRAANGDPTRFALPRPMRSRKEAHFSFAGLKTAVRQRAQETAPLTERDVSDLCASFQAAVIDSVVDRCRRAIEIVKAMPDIECDTLVIAGGVAANEQIRAALTALAAQQSMKMQAPPLALCGDNAAMVAWAGIERFALGLTDTLETPVRPRWPLDKDAPAAIGAGVKA